MLDSVTATVIRAGQASATVTSHVPEVTAWAQRYFQPWWSATDAPLSTIDAVNGPVIVADVDPGKWQRLAGNAEVADDGSVTATSRTEGVAYHHSPGARQIQIAGCTAPAAKQAAASLAREVVRTQLEHDGWVLVRASAATRHCRAVRTFGGNGAGKTTIALILAQTGQWGLLANDRVLARAHHLGVQLLTWPATTAIGLGLLDALGFYDIAREQLRAGEHLHPTQDERVTRALRNGDRTPLWEPSNRELKVQFFPHQLRDCFGLRLATSGHAAPLLFPAIARDTAPSTAEQPRGLTEADFLSATEDRYPDIFGLQRTDSDTWRHHRNTVAERLAHLPRHAAKLGHDAKVNTAALAWILAGF